MSQNFRLFRVSNLSVRNFRIFLLMYTGTESESNRRWALDEVTPDFESGAVTDCEYSRVIPLTIPLTSSAWSIVSAMICIACFFVRLITS